jgi:hypothetical protein
MARKPIEREFEDNLLDEVILNLREGAYESGVTLTKDECAILLKKLPPTREPPRWWYIAQFSFDQEDGPGSTEAAIRTTMDKFNVGRQTVFDARQRFHKYEML